MKKLIIILSLLILSGCATFDSDQSRSSTGLGTDPFTPTGDFLNTDANAMNNAINDNDSRLDTAEATLGSDFTTGSNLTGVDAATGDSATAFFDAGTIEHERGGLEADVSAYTGIPAITGGATYELDTTAELHTATNIAPVPEWKTATAYSTTTDATNKLVFNDGIFYKCIVSHTSGDTDDEPGTGATWQTYWQAGGSGFDADNPGEIGSVTPSPTIYADEVDVTRSATVGDSIDLYEASNNPDDDYIRLKVPNNLENTSTATFLDKADDYWVGPPTVHQTVTANTSIRGGDAAWDIYPMTGANTEITIEEDMGHHLTFLSKDAETKYVRINTADVVCWENPANTWECLDAGDDFSFTDIGKIELIRRDPVGAEVAGFDVIYTDVTLTDAGVGCTTWNCGAPGDANFMAIWNFDDGALTTDSSGEANTLTLASGSPVADTDAGDFIQGDASALFTTADNDVYTLDDDADELGYVASGIFTILFRYKAPASAVNRVIVVKGTGVQDHSSFRIQLGAAGKIGLAVDEDDDGDWDNETITQNTVDDTWYDVAVGLNTSNHAYFITVVEHVDDAVGTDWGSVSGTWAGSAGYNLNDTTTNFSISESGTNGFDGLIDELTVVDRYLSGTEVNEWIAGDYGQ